MNIYLDLFLTFAKVGACTFGGGYAMLPILQKEVVEKRHWSTDDELNDYFAIGQCTPGIIAVNTATFIGSSQKGVIGGILATLGVVFPSIVIICIIAACLTSFQDEPLVIHAFAGIRACVCVLILNAVIKLFKSSIIDLPTAFIFLAAFGISVFLGLSPALLVILAGIIGLSVHLIRSRKLAKPQGEVAAQSESTENEPAQSDKPAS